MDVWGWVKAVGAVALWLLASAAALVALPTGASVLLAGGAATLTVLAALDRHHHRAGGSISEAILHGYRLAVEHGRAETPVPGPLPRAVGDDRYLPAVDTDHVAVILPFPPAPPASN